MCIWIRVPPSWQRHLLLPVSVLTLASMISRSVAPAATVTRAGSGICYMRTRIHINTRLANRAIPLHRQNHPEV